MEIDLESLAFTELIRLQTQLGEVLQRRFSRTLALLFTDVAGSTPYFARFGDAAGRALQQRHLDHLRAALPAGRGRIVDTAGDGAFAVFPSADDAVVTLLGFERLVAQGNATHPREHQLHVRAGLHCGAVLTDGEAVTGDAVNLAARVCASSEPGEVRLTEAVFRELSPPRRARCRGLGPAELRGVPGPVTLLTLRWHDDDGFPTRFRILETGEERALPPLGVITFGRLKEQGGVPANDVVLALPDPEQALRISRWHFELRRGPGGFVLRSVSDRTTEVDGVAAPKGVDVPLRPGSRVVVSGVVTLEFLPAAGSDAADGPATTAGRL
jgi:class 3 adenylate cyclase